MPDPPPATQGTSDPPAQPAQGDTRITPEQEATLQTKLQVQLQAIEAKTLKQENDTLKQKIAELEQSVIEKATVEKDVLLKDLPESLRKLAHDKSIDFIQGLLVAQTQKQGLPLTPPKPASDPSTPFTKEGTFDKETNRWIPKRTLQPKKKK